MAVVPAATLLWHTASTSVLPPGLCLPLPRLPTEPGTTLAPSPVGIVALLGAGQRGVEGSGVVLSGGLLGTLLGLLGLLCSR